MTDFVVVFTTVGADFDAAGLARTLVERRLAACVQIVPGLTSIYRWQGEIQTDAEQQIVMKTSRSMLAALKDAVEALHPYETPEWLVVSAEAGRAYADWAASQLTDDWH
jgi:periplasmic divalent cation tolerance protein